MPLLIYVVNTLFILAPNAPPVIQTGYNLSSTSIFISWSKIPDKNLRGIFLGFRITYRLVKEGKELQNT